MDYNVIFEGRNLERLLEGLLITGRIALISVIISALLGIVFGIIMLSKSKVIKVVSNIYLEAFRIIPIIVWLFLGYFGLPKATNLHLDGEIVSILVFSLWGIAEMGDLVRGAITSIHKIQEESALALGLNRNQVYIYVLIPQAVRRVLPGVINLTTRMIKTTSLVVLIGVVEVVKVANQIIEVYLLKAPSASFWIYGFVFFLYFILCYPLSILSKRVERKWEG